MLKLDKNKNAPHVAVIKVYIEYHEQLSSGELSGNVTDKVEFLDSIKGENFNNCSEKVNEIFKQLKVKEDE